MIPVEKIVLMGWQVNLNTPEHFEIQWRKHTFQIVERNNFFALTAPSPLGWTTFSKRSV